MTLCSRQGFQPPHAGGDAWATEGGIVRHLQGLLCLQEGAGPRAGEPRCGQRGPRARGAARGNPDDPGHRHHEAHPEIHAAALWEPQLQPTGTEPPHGALLWGMGGLASVLVVIRCVYQGDMVDSQFGLYRTTFTFDGTRLLFICEHNVYSTIEIYLKLKSNTKW